MDLTALAQTLDRVVARRYRVDELIGVGTVSGVFVAFDLVEGRAVALKVFDEACRNDDQFIERLFAAAENAATLDHQNIVKVYDWGIDDGPFVVSELCEGGSLAMILGAGHRLSASQALVMTLESARALHYGHQRGLVHRNLKPSNVLFAADQRVRLCEYGFAQVLAEAPISVESRGVEAVRYASPEQARGRQVSEPSDLYSLALVVNEAVSGEPPFVTDTVVGTLMARAEAPAALSDALSALLPVLDRCGQVESVQRPEAEELTIALLAAAETMPRPATFPLFRVGVAAPVDEEEPDPYAENDESDRWMVIEGESTAIDPAEPSSFEGFDEFRGSGEPDAMGTLGGDRGLELSGVATPSIEAEPDLATSSVPRVGLENLAEAEPVFAVAPEPPGDFDVPTRATAPRIEVARGPAETDDVDDRLPWWPLLVLALLVAGVVAAIVYFSTAGSGQDSAVVPDVVGVRYEELANVVAGRGWQIERLEDRVENTDPGTIVSQSPAAGETLDEGDRLTVTVSLGNEMIEIPADVVGLTLEQAESRLGSVGLLVGELTEEHNESLAAGLVVALAEPTTQKPAGEAVALRISLGPLARVVPPSVIGMTIADATALLTGLRLQAVEEPAYDPEAPPGTILGSIPEPGTELPADSQVTLLVSAGPAPVEIPDIVGLPLDEAIDAIEELGLIFIDTEGTPGEDAIGTIPEIGETVDVGTEVIIILGEPGEDEGDDG